LNLRKKIFLLTTALVAAVYTLALIFVQRQVGSATFADTRQHLRTTMAAMAEYEEDIQRNRKDRVRLLASSRELVPAIERQDATELTAWVQRLHRPGQLLAVTTADGKVLAADGFGGPIDDPVLRKVEPLRSMLSGTPGEGRGLWRLGGQLYDLVAAPVLAPDGHRVGAILYGARLSGSAIRHLRGLTQSDILLVSQDGGALASSLPEAVAREIASARPQLSSTEPRRIEARGSSYLALAHDLPVDYGERRYSEVFLRSLDGSDQLSYQIGSGLLIIGVIAGVLAFVFAWLGARRIALPLRKLSATMSAMTASGKLESDFASAGGDREVRLIENTFRQLMVSLEESQRARERSYVEAVGAVVTAADARDHETTGHSFRVAHYAVALARTMGLRGEQLKAIEWGALLHDVGKMVVPDEILRKVGPLTEDEWYIMRQHPNWGFDMLAEVSFLQQPALEIVYSHHERWDGKGYPRGLAGEEIPLAARIFAAVDTYDAITSDRPYRRAHGHQSAVAELERVAGQQLDPQVVEAFRQIPEVELRRLRDLCKRFHPGLSLPSDLLADLAEPATRRAEEPRTAMKA